MLSNKNDQRTLNEIFLHTEFDELKDEVVNKMKIIYNPNNTKNIRRCSKFFIIF